MERRKLTKEDIDKVRGIEGFPIGTDEDIIALSDAPYYTACPNPFIEDFVRENGTLYDEATDDYHCEPFAADVSEGKNDPLYNAHGYHTKVPHKAIMRYILHYTKPGDIVFDGFSGTGMTGLAAQACGAPDYSFKHQIETEMKGVEWGKRFAILNDLSPIATLIAKNYNRKYDPAVLQKKANMVLSECEKKYGWMYQTNHTEAQQGFLLPEMSKGTINQTIWSDVLICPHCGEEFIFWDVGLDHKAGKVLDKFRCPKCHADLAKKDCAHAIEYTEHAGQVYSLAKQVPVYIVYDVNGKRYKKTPDADDLALIKRIEELPFEAWYPEYDLPDGDKTSDPKKLGITRTDLFYTKRNLIILSSLRECLFNELSFLYTALTDRTTKQLRLLVNYFFHGGGGWVGTGLSGTLYVPSLSIETNPLVTFATKIKRTVVPTFTDESAVCIQCASAGDLRTIPDDSIDYIFTDPPFGYNINYSELSFLWESWLKCFTNTNSEAIISKAQNKQLVDYQMLMQKGFEEFFRILKPNRWMTVEFHNSQNSVWNAIQEALNRAGFIVADVRTIDKKQASFNQVKGSTQAIKQDLVISVYKPKASFRRDFILEAGSEETAWKFVRQHLEKIPVVVVKNEKIEITAERQAYLLFDRMVAYHIMNGIPVPLDATEFYRGLDERFLLRDTMYFLPDQVNEYDTARIVNDVEPIQFSLFVTNEKTAISWLYQQLSEEFGGPQTYAEIQPKFMQEVKSVDRYEDMPELAVLLEENFLQDDKGRWYIPDVTKEGDVAKLREKKLWKEFEGYLNSKGKLKLFRSEAIRVGFSRLWKDKNYQAIVDIAERLPESTIQEDPNLLMYYDISLSRVE